MSLNPSGFGAVSKTRDVVSHRAWAGSAAILAAVIFAVDTFTSLETAIAVFYVIVILLVAGASRREYLIATSIGCIILTIGSYVTVHGSAEPGAPLIRSIVSLSAIGITSILVLRNHAVEAMLREQASLLELTHDAIFVRDMNDRIRFWNRSAEELFGWPASEAIGRRSAELMRTQYPAAQDVIRKTLLEQGRWEGELVHTSKYGSRIVTASRWSLQRKGERPVAVLDTNTDITARALDQETLRKTQSALAHAARVATLGEMSASIAHEINQPLAAIVTNGEAAVRWLARTEPDLQEAKDAVRRIIQDGSRASEVIRRIRLVSKKNEPNNVLLSLNDALSEALAMLQLEIATRGVVLQLDLAERLPLVEADRIQIQQVLMNLLINAVQAMEGREPGQRRLCVRSLVEVNGDISLQVQDSGVGFDEETERNLFNAFFTTKGSGLGLGLSICRSIIEAHGGRIWATRNPDAGATFHISLPFGGAA